MRNTLLIVPEGIEISYLIIKQFVVVRLLIVPEGIEIAISHDGT